MGGAGGDPQGAPRGTGGIIEHGSLARNLTMHFPPCAAVVGSSFFRVVGVAPVLIWSSSRKAPQALASACPSRSCGFSGSKELWLRCIAFRVGAFACVGSMVLAPFPNSLSLFGFPSAVSPWCPEICCCELWLVMVWALLPIFFGLLHLFASGAYRGMG